ncbi:ExbD/TolR family protein [Caulobacter sp. KR2-114]|uniref:ExbD/TolR family protein n=1 Tax=Caulobacter sp. KR2-114 TaxID=3400912 RepID=UPI003C0B2F16
MAAKLSGGGGGKKFSLGQNADINVTPFVDVMLVLLIIFMVTAPLATVSIKLDLPPATPPKNPDSKPPTFISIQDSGRIYVSFGKSDIRESRLENLSNDLATSLGVPNPTNERVFIRADKHVKYREFMDVINQLQTDGYFKIGLISEEL